jgi:hypothetical protein
MVRPRGTIELRTIARLEILDLHRVQWHDLRTEVLHSFSHTYLRAARIVNPELSLAGFVARLEIMRIF